MNYCDFPNHWVLLLDNILHQLRWSLLPEMTNVSPCFCSTKLPPKTSISPFQGKPLYRCGTIRTQSLLNVSGGLKVGWKLPWKWILEKPRDVNCGVSVILWFCHVRLGSRWNIRYIHLFHFHTLGRWCFNRWSELQIQCIPTGYIRNNTPKRWLRTLFLNINGSGKWLYFKGN